MRLIKSYEDEHSIIKDQARVKDIVIYKTNKHPVSNQVTTDFQDNPIKYLSSTQRRELNKRVGHLTKLVGLIYKEFTSIKETHTQYLNILVLFSFICLSYSLSLVLKFTATGSIPELIILTSLVISTLIPMIGTLLFCAGVERAVSINLHIQNGCCYAIYQKLTLLLFIS